MNYRAFLILALIANCLFAIQKGTIKNVRSAATPNEYAKLLTDFGTPDSIITMFLKNDYRGLVERMEEKMPSSPLFTKKHFVRAETFRSDLDADTNTEYVSQIVFQTGDQKTDNKYYFIYLHDDTKADCSLLKFLLFEEMLCNLSNPNPVTFKFVNGQSKSIVFDISRAESCGDEIYTYQRSDTLFLEKGKYVLRTGAPFNVFESNSMNLLRDSQN